jgi:hypothetical protein
LISVEVEDEAETHVAVSIHKEMQLELVVGLGLGVAFLLLLICFLAFRWRRAKRTPVHVADAAPEPPMALPWPGDELPRTVSVEAIPVLAEPLLTGAVNSSPTKGSIATGQGDETKAACSGLASDGEATGIHPVVAHSGCGALWHDPEQKRGWDGRSGPVLNEIGRAAMFGRYHDVSSSKNNKAMSPRTEGAPKDQSLVPTAQCLEGDVNQQCIKIDIEAADESQIIIPTAEPYGPSRYAQRGRRKREPLPPIKDTQPADDGTSDDQSFPGSNLWS